MKITVNKIDNKQPNGFRTTEIPLNTEKHNLRFSHAEGNHLYFQIHRFPYKELTGIVAEKEEADAIISFSKSFIRLDVTKQGVRPHFVARYNVETSGDAIRELRKRGEISWRYIVEKERAFNMAAEQDELITLADPFVKELQSVNTSHSAALFLEWFNDWAYPVTLDDVTASLTDDQKIQAAKMLKAFFAA